MFIPTPASSTNNFAAWDQWVAARVAARSEAMHAVMKEAGLKEPLPGLADMKSRGSFFECQPYGTCWEPTNGWAKAPATKMANDGPPAAEGAPTAEASSQAEQTQKKQAPPTQEELRALDAAQNARPGCSGRKVDEQQAEGQMPGGGVAPAMWVEDDQAFSVLAVFAAELDDAGSDDRRGCGAGERRGVGRRLVQRLWI